LTAEALVELLRLLDDAGIAVWLRGREPDQGSPGSVRPACAGSEQLLTLLRREVEHLRQRIDYLANVEILLVFQKTKKWVLTGGCALSNSFVTRG
jgi:hypothetical protein